ncbi:MAG: hypothetical protein EXR62_14150 [Chloroflexi bacterium]|nr:hypothetical protein [Chloroflexota bacterium]
MVEYKMLNDTWLLLSLRWQVAWNGFLSRKPLAKVLLVLGALWIGVIVGGGSAALGYGAGSLLRRFPQLHLEPLIPGAILTAIAVILFLTSFGVALGSLFLTNDLEMLMSAPVDRRAVFISKILDGMAFYYGIIAIAAAPALITYGLGLQYGPLYYLLVLITLLGTPLFPASVGALLVMLVARFAPARRVREVLGLSAALVGMSCSLLGQTTRLWTQRISGVSADPQAFLSQIQVVTNFPIPTLVAGRGLSEAGLGDWVPALVNLSGFLVLTFGFFAVTIFLADYMYTTGWIRMQSSGSAARSRKQAAKDAAHSGLLGGAPAPLALALKDWRVIPRDLRNFAQLLAPLLFLPVVYINLIGGTGRNSTNVLQLADRYGLGMVNMANVFIAVGILASTILVFSRIGLTSISMEGKSWWILKVAPLSGFELLRGKYLSAVVPFAVLSSLLMIGAAIWRHFSVWGFLYGWFGVELLGAGMLAIAIGFAVPWARLDWDDPRGMSSGWGTLFAFIGYILLGIVGGGLLGLPVILSIFRPELVGVGWIAGVIGAVVVTTGVAWLALQFGLSRLSAVGESG